MPCELITIEAPRAGFKGEDAQRALKAQVAWFEKYWAWRSRGRKGPVKHGGEEMANVESQISKRRTKTKVQVLANEQ